MKLSTILCGCALAFFVNACSNGSKYAEAKRVADEIGMADSIKKADSIKAVEIHSSAAVENRKDSVHKFIRTAELKFKVKSVIKSTYNIEDIITRNGGFVTYTKLESTIEGSTSSAVSADSSLETTFYRVSNSIILQVPNTKLDTTLKEIAHNIDYLDYRIIKADDVALQIFGNTLTQKRSSKNEERLVKAIDNRGKKLKETTTAEEILVNKQEEADRAKVANMSLRDQINYSTINITIYQSKTVSRELVSNNNNTKSYEPGFGTKVMDALKFGWVMLSAILLFLVNLWGFVVLGLVILILYRIYVRKFPQKKQ